MTWNCSYINICRLFQHPWHLPAVVLSWPFFRNNLYFRPPDERILFYLQKGDWRRQSKAGSSGLPSRIPGRLSAFRDKPIFLLFRVRESRNIIIFFPAWWKQWHHRKQHRHGHYKGNQPACEASFFQFSIIHHIHHLILSIFLKSAQISLFNGITSDLIILSFVL